MSRRLFIALLLALPFIGVGTFVYAAWTDPPEGVTPPDGNLPGPVWLQTGPVPDVQVGYVSIDGVLSAGAISGISDSDYGVYGSTTSPTGYAGLFGGTVFAEKFCVGDPSSPGDPASCTEVGSAGGDSYWSLQASTTDSIYKTIATGIVGIGTDTTPNNDFPTGTKLAIVGNTGQGPRLYISNSTGNPEINFRLSGSSNDHWGIYADASGASPSRDLRFWSPEIAGTVGADRFKLTSQGVMVFSGWGQGVYAYTLNVAKAGTGNGNVTSSPAGINCGSTCSANYTPQTITLTASATTGCFTNWSGDSCSGSTSTQCPVVITNSNKNVTANFTNPCLYALTVTVTGSGSVSSNPAGIAGCTDGGVGDCAENYASSTLVTLNASWNNRAVNFCGWGGACSGTSSSCQVTMDASKNVTARFSAGACSIGTGGTGGEGEGAEN